MENKDIDEIISHIQKLKKITSNKTTSDDSMNDSTKESTEIGSKKTKKISKKQDNNKSKKINDNQNIKDTISHIENSEPVSIMNSEVIGLTDESTVICDVCEKDIVLGKNLSGLVVADEFFACEHCCQHLSKEELMDWTKSKMASTPDVRPIGLWVIQQQRENK